MIVFHSHTLLFIPIQKYVFFVTSKVFFRVAFEFRNTKVAFSKIQFGMSSLNISLERKKFRSSIEMSEALKLNETSL